MRKTVLTIAASIFAFSSILAPTSSQASNSFADPSLRPSQSPLWNARLDGLDPDAGTFSVTDCPQAKSNPNSRPYCQGASFNLTVKNPALKTRLKLFQVGDHIRVSFDDKGMADEIAGTSISYVSTKNRFVMLLVCFLVPFAIAFVLTWGHPTKLIVGMDNRYSNSKLQAALWFWVLLATYLEVVYFRVCVGGLDFLGGIGIPQNLLLLSGMSAITFTGAKAITTAKVNAAANPVAPPGALVAPTPNTDPKNSLNPGEESFFRDIVQNDLGSFDFGDFQMVIVTMLAICTYVLAVHHYLGAVNLTSSTSLPDVDTTILSTFGLGQGAYLAKKAAGNVAGA